MLNARLFVIVVLSAAALAASAARVSAGDQPLGCTGPYCGVNCGIGCGFPNCFSGCGTGCGKDGCCGLLCNKMGYPNYYTLGGYATGGCAKKPTFQAAPWYLYWPYDGHFLTPAPVTGAFYGPPVAGNFPVNPYFPGPAYGYYGPIPGGPAPR